MNDGGTRGVLPLAQAVKQQMVDSRLMERNRQRHARRAGADDQDFCLGSHGSLICQRLLTFKMRD